MGCGEIGKPREGRISAQSLRLDGAILNVENPMRFICCADETSDENPRKALYYGGFVAPEEDWQYFESAWRERVLDRRPSIPYLHMTETRSKAWRAQHRISATEVTGRIDEAACIIRSAGALMPIVFRVGVSEFRDLIAGPFRHVRALRQPDYVAFRLFAYSVMDCVHSRYGAGHTVDFKVEENSTITKTLRAVHEDLAASLRESIPRFSGMAEGRQLQIVSKEDIAAQAADVFLWHARNGFNGTLDLDGQRAYFKMKTGGGNSRANRWGFSLDIGDSTGLLGKLAAGFAESERRAASGGATQ